jgi:hypothetical protein
MREYKMVEMGTSEYLSLLDTRLLPDPGNNWWKANPDGWHQRAVVDNQVFFCRERMEHGQDG